MSKYYASVSEDGDLLGYYIDDIHSDIPTTAIEITKEQWQEALNINANKLINGSLVYHEIEPEPLTAEQQWEELKIQRQQELDNSTVTLSNGTVMDGDELAYNRMKNASDALADDTTTVEFTDANNEQVHLTKALLYEGFLLGAQQHSTIWANYAALRLELGSTI